jgi:multiple sugar transport system ATP-binding protein
VSRPFLEVRALAKRFGSRTALAGVDLDLGAGELLVVLGPTGAGKTTLLRTIAGLEPPDGGALVLDGHDVTRASPAERDVALVFQNFSLYPGWSVRRNLEFPLRAPGRSLAPDEIDRRVRWAAELLRISHLLERESKRLSGGEMQRVAIGRAIVRRPRLFLMDEPLSNLDAKLREALRAELALLARELGTPMIYVTHDQAEALSMADRIAVLIDGQVRQVGAPRDVYLRPVSPIVARQLGQPPINVIRARREAGAWVASDGTVLAPVALDAPATARLGIRPEHVLPDGGRSECVVEVIEDWGSARVLLVRWAGERVHLLVPRSFDAGVGRPVRPRILSEHLIVWNASAEGES